LKPVSKNPIKDSKDSFLADSKAGGSKEKCDQDIKSGKYLSTNPTPVREDLVRQEYETQIIFEQHPFRVIPASANGNIDVLLNNVAIYLEEQMNRAQGYIDHINRYLRLMITREQPFAMNLFNPSYTQYIYHMNWYKKTYYDKKTGENFYGLKHRKTAMEAYLTSIGINPLSWPFTLPHQPKRKFVPLPSPQIVHDIMHYNYYPDDKDLTTLFQYIHTFNFLIGPRVPSENVLLNVSSYNETEGYIDIVEEKTHYSIRRVYPELVYLTAKTRKSLNNYLNYVRPKFEDSQSPDALFLNTIGHRFTEGNLGQYLSETGKKVYANFYPYMARHWCASSLLQQCYLNKDDDPLEYVQGYMGHEKRVNTEGYVNQTRTLARRYPFDWRKRVLKFSNDAEEENTLKIETKAKNPCFESNSSKTLKWACPNLNRSL
jgi:integrase